MGGCWIGNVASRSLFSKIRLKGIPNLEVHMLMSDQVWVIMQGLSLPGLIGYRVWPHVRESQLHSLDIWVSSILDYLDQLSPVT